MATSYNMAAPPPERHAGPAPSRPHEPPEQRAPSQPIPRAGEQLLVVKSNYSITPGPVWLEAKNPAIITVSSTPVRLDLPLQGSGFLWRSTERPIVCAVLPAQGPPFDQRDRWGDEAHEPKPPDWQWWPACAWQPKTECTGTRSLDEERVERIEEQEKQKEEEKKKEQEKKAKQTPEQQQKEQEKAQEERQKMEAEARAEGRAAPPPGHVDEWLQRTGLSAEGFPGFPRSLPTGFAAGSGLPATAGINRVALDQAADPPELVVYLVGTGSIPAGRRWLFFTLNGV